jgi:hypothetical protein
MRNFGNPATCVTRRESKTGGTISYHYSLAVPRIDVPALPGNAWFIGSLKGPQPSTYTSRIPYRQGEVYFTAHFPNPVDQIHNVLWQGPVSCPPVPPKELKSFFAG